MMLYRSQCVQLFGYTPRAPRARNSKRRALGVCLRVRCGDRWRHYQIWMHWPAKTWLTDDSFKHSPQLKSFVRLKVGLGGGRS
jgi:hypothetical protein